MSLAMPREEYVLIVGADTRSVGEQSRRFNRAALVAGFLGVTMCVALASLAVRGDSSAADELLGLKVGSSAGSGLALELVKAAPTASVSELQEKIDKYFNSLSSSPPVNLESLSLKSNNEFQSLEDTGKLCAKKDIIIAKFDELLAKLMRGQKILDDQLAAVKAAYEAARDAWLACDAEYRLAESKNKDAKEGAKIAKDKYEKWDDAVKLAWSHLDTVEKEYNSDYDDVLAERALIVEIMRLIGVLEDLPLAVVEEQKNAPPPPVPKDADPNFIDNIASKVQGVVNGIKIAMDNAPFPVPPKLVIEPIIPKMIEAVKAIFPPPPPIVLPKIEFPKFKFWANDPKKNEALQTRLAQVYQKSASMGPRFQGQIQKLTETLAETAETKDVKVILNQILAEISDRAQTLNDNYEKAKTELKEHQDKAKDYEKELVNLSDAADKAEQQFAAKGIEREKLAAAHVSAKEAYEDEKAKKAAIFPDFTAQIKIINTIKSKLTDFCNGGDAPPAGPETPLKKEMETPTGGSGSVPPMS